MRTQENKPLLLKSPTSIFLIVAISVFLSEALIMSLLHCLPEQAIFSQTIIDSTLLVILISPILYFFLFRPLVNHIRERERIEDVLRKNEEEQIKVMIRTSVDAFQITDIHRHILEINDAFCEMTGYSREKLLTMKASDLEAEESPEEAERYLNKLLEAGSHRLNIRLRRKDGQIRIVKMSSNYSELNDGRIYSFLHDITDEKKAEAELNQHRYRLKELVDIRTNQLDKQTRLFESANKNLANKLDDCKHTNRKLKEQADELTALYHNAPCGYHSLNPDGIIVQINDTELKWLGLTREEVVGKMEFAGLLTPASSRIFRESFQHYNEKDFVSTDLQLEIMPREGSSLPVLMSTKLVKDAANQFKTSHSVMVKLGKHSS